MTEYDRGWTAAMEFIAKWMDAAQYNVTAGDYETAEALSLLRSEIAIIARDQIKEPATRAPALEALRKYGRHIGDCGVTTGTGTGSTYRFRFSDAVCTCGLDAALGQASEPGEDDGR